MFLSLYAYVNILLHDVFNIIRYYLKKIFPCSLESPPSGLLIWDIAKCLSYCNASGIQESQILVHFIFSLRRQEIFSWQFICIGFGWIPRKKIVKHTRKFTQKKFLTTFNFYNMYALNYMIFCSRLKQNEKGRFINLVLTLYVYIRHIFFRHYSKKKNP